MEERPCAPRRHAWEIVSALNVRATLGKRPGLDLARDAICAVLVVAVSIEIAVDSFRVRVDQVSPYDYAKIRGFRPQ